MNLTESLRAGRIAAIKQNPVEITITRREKVRQGGGLTELPPREVGPFTVRIARGSSRLPGIQAGTPGTAMVDDRLILMADHTADIQAGPNVTDEFMVDGEKHKVTSAFRILSGPDRQVIGYQADIEKVI